jgi:hypothetical protein
MIRAPGRVVFLLMRAPLLLLFFAGCVVSDRYLVSPDTTRVLAAMPESARANAAVPATRKKDGKQVLLRGSTIDLSQPGASEVKAGMRSKMVIAGQALTWIGTGISLAGSVLFFGFRSGLLHEAGGGLALSAESIMWTGTGLWIAGQRAHPMEVPTGQRSVQLLSP